MLMHSLGVTIRVSTTSSGVVIDHVQGVDDSTHSIVSMTWGGVCDVEVCLEFRFDKASIIWRFSLTYFEILLLNW